MRVIKLKRLPVKLFQFFSLFGSIGTLFCCALPFTLVSLGMGAVFASLTAAFPQIHWILKYKVILFSATGVLLAVSYLLMKHSQKLNCKTVGSTNIVCEQIKPKIEWIFWIAAALYITGLSFSYVIPLFLGSR